MASSCLLSAPLPFRPTFAHTYTPLPYPITLTARDCRVQAVSLSPRPQRSHNCIFTPLARFCFSVTSSLLLHLFMFSVECLFPCSSVCGPVIPSLVSLTQPRFARSAASPTHRHRHKSSTLRTSGQSLVPGSVVRHPRVAQVALASWTCCDSRSDGQSADGCPIGRGGSVGQGGRKITVLPGVKSGGGKDPIGLDWRIWT